MWTLIIHFASIQYCRSKSQTLYNNLGESPGARNITNAMSLMTRQRSPNRILLHESHFIVYHVAGMAIAQSAGDRGATELTKLLESVLYVRLYIGGLQPYRSVAEVKTGSLLAADYAKGADKLCIQVTWSGMTSYRRLYGASIATELMGAAV
jgi:hypothetical protein